MSTPTRSFNCLLIKQSCKVNFLLCPNLKLTFRTLFKFTFLTLPCSAISLVCFVSSQRTQGYAEAGSCTFAIFHLLTALSMLYIVFSSQEGRWFETCKKRQVLVQNVQEIELDIRGKPNWTLDKFYINVLCLF